MGALANATGLEISSSILSSIPQNLENGSRVSGAAPKLTYDSPISVLVPDDEEEECNGDKMGSRVREVLAMRDGPGRSADVISVGEGRMAKGGTPLEGDARVAVRDQRLRSDFPESSSMTCLLREVAMLVALSPRDLAQMALSTAPDWSSAWGPPPLFDSFELQWCCSYELVYSESPD